MFAIELGCVILLRFSVRNQTRTRDPAGIKVCNQTRMRDPAGISVLLAINLGRVIVDWLRLSCYCNVGIWVCNHPRMRDSAGN